jgi:hypothetical protein
VGWRRSADLDRRSQRELARNGSTHGTLHLCGVLLTSHRADLAADRVRMINRLRDVLTSVFLALEREFDFASCKRALELPTSLEGALSSTLVVNRLSGDPAASFCPVLARLDIATPCLQNPRGEVGMVPDVHASTWLAGRGRGHRARHQELGGRLQDQIQGAQGIHGLTRKRAVARPSLAGGRRLSARVEDIPIA